MRKNISVYYEKLKESIRTLKSRQLGDNESKNQHDNDPTEFKNRKPTDDKHEEYTALCRGESKAKVYFNYFWT